MVRRSSPVDRTPKPFTGFGAGALGFFADLDAEQSREWFEANRPVYEAQARGPMESLVASLSFALAARDIPLTGDPRRALFRIHRDVRFGRDKRPYKTNVSAVLTRDGDKGSAGLLYIDIGHADCFAALGFWQPEPEQLALFRERIMERPEEWRAIEASLAARGKPLLRDGAAARLPRGLDPVRSVGLEDTLKLKSFVVRQPIPPAEIGDPGLVDRLAVFAETGLPLLAFGWSALVRRAVAP